MRIRYTGLSGMRIVDGVAWTRDERVQEVDDPTLVSNLLTHEGFAVAEDEPLLQIMDVNWVALLALETGVVTVGALAKLTNKQIKETADSLGVPQSDVKGWVTAAGALVKTPADDQPSGEELIEQDNTLTGDQVVALSDDGGE